MNFQIEAKLGVEKHNLEEVIITVKREGTGRGGGEVTAMAAAGT